MRSTFQSQELQQAPVFQRCDNTYRSIRLFESMHSDDLPLVFYHAVISSGFIIFGCMSPPGPPLYSTDGRLTYSDKATAGMGMSTIEDSHYLNLRQIG